MEPPDPNNANDDVFLDAVDVCPSGKDPSESSASDSTAASSLCDPEPIADESRHSQSSPANTIRRRPSRRGSFKETAGLSFDSSVGSDSDLINKARRSFRRQHSYKDHRNLKENERLVENCDSIAELVESSLATSEPREEDKEESTITTTAANDDTVGDIADSAGEVGISSPNFLESIAGLVIKAIGLQIHLFVMFITYPMLFLYHCCMFFINPFRTMSMGREFSIRILSRAWDGVCGFIGPSVHGLFGEHKSIWKLALRYGWGFLWAIYVCLILFSLLVSSLLASGFVIKFFMDKPIHRKEILNFDYTRQSPVAYVPLTSCPGIGEDIDSENTVDASNWMGARVIPPRHRVQVTVLLLVPESEYNRNLGIFQVIVLFNPV